jgi:U4/U6 small nuclear ribonucleoprotein PRP31
MFLLITATTTTGQQLSENEWAAIERACDLADRLEETRKKVCCFYLFFFLFQLTKAVTDIYVCEFEDERPPSNLSALVGTSTAANILGVAGGLTGLVKMPSCNI